MNDKLIDNLFDDIHELVLKHAELGLNAKDIAYSLLSSSYDITCRFGPKEIDLGDMFVGMAMECVDSMRIPE